VKEDDATSAGPLLSGRAWIHKVFNALSPLERAIFIVLSGIVVVSTLTVLAELNSMLLTEVPARGGTLKEGVINSPRFINPLLSISDSDRDFTQLIYSGLMRATPEGELVPNLAEDYTISEDGRTYTFTIREEAIFHDGVPVRSDDVLYTISRAQDPALKSPRRASWDGVIVEKLDERTISFTLPQPYAPFLENATLGILPQHLWDEVTIEEFPFSQLNIEPIGSGPYRISRIERSSAGLPISYELKAFSEYLLEEPFIETLIFSFYPNEDELIRAYIDREVDAIHSISPQRARALEEIGARIETGPLPRIFGVFFNQNEASIFTDETVREALILATPQRQIIEDVLYGYAIALDSPIPPELITDEEHTPAREADIEAARELLIESGWEYDAENNALSNDDAPLSFTLATSNSSELKAIGTLLAETWRAVGIQVETQFFETSNLNQNIIRPRRYDALLFGEIVGRELDLFSFWHSSQRNDPGLNIALYANITTDSLLENARATTDRRERFELYRAFEEEITNDAPAVFLYAPFFIYVVPKDIHGLRLGPVTTSGERFLNVHEWYVETEHVWPVFND
jgi:peptide/nickel transport system substrate-binding protein